ncbi:MAG: DNA methyltransferase, partial [Pseudomonadota bacterium]
IFNDDLQMRSDWTLPICSGGERLKDENGQKSHPTQKPESLLYRVLTASTNRDDVVLDPFCGTGTTPAVARKLGRRFVAFEREARYAKIARARILKTQTIRIDALLEGLKEKRRETRIPFGALIENGLIKPGTQLTSACKRHHAYVAADGSLINDDAGRGSIHKLGAKLQGRESCNGWDYWQLPGRIPIDALRQKCREGLFSPKADLKKS